MEPGNKMLKNAENSTKYKKAKWGENGSHQKREMHMCTCAK
jgi:hypothetical protein